LNVALSSSGLEDTYEKLRKRPFGKSKNFLAAQMSVFMVFGGPHLPLVFQFVCGPGQVEGFSLFGYAAAGGRWIRYK